MNGGVGAQSKIREEQVGARQFGEDGGGGRRTGGWSAPPGMNGAGGIRVPDGLLF